MSACLAVQVRVVLPPSRTAAAVAESAGGGSGGSGGRAGGGGGGGGAAGGSSALDAGSAAPASGPEAWLRSRGFGGADAAHALEIAGARGGGAPGGEEVCALLALLKAMQRGPKQAWGDSEAADAEAGAEAAAAAEAAAEAAGEGQAAAAQALQEEVEVLESIFGPGFTLSQETAGARGAARVLRIGRDEVAAGATLELWLPPGSRYPYEACLPCLCLAAPHAPPSALLALGRALLDRAAELAAEGSPAAFELSGVVEELLPSLLAAPPPQQPPVLAPPSAAGAVPEAGTDVEDVEDEEDAEGAGAGGGAAGDAVRNGGRGGGKGKGGGKGRGGGKGERGPSAAQAQRQSAQLQAQQKELDASASHDKMRSVRRSLPAQASRTELLRQLRDHRALVVCGETGCGKSTQAPQTHRVAGWVRRVAGWAHRVAGWVHRVTGASTHGCRCHSTSSRRWWRRGAAARPRLWSRSRDASPPSRSPRSARSHMRYSP